MCTGLQGGEGMGEVHGALDVPVCQLRPVGGPSDGVHEAVSRIHVPLIFPSSPGFCSSIQSWPLDHAPYNSE